MTGITIVRPQVSITRHRNGNTSYKVDGNAVEYHRIGWSSDEKNTKRLTDGFIKEYDRLAKLIETGKDQPYHIMRMFVDHNMFRMVHKLPDTKYQF